MDEMADHKVVGAKVTEQRDVVDEVAFLFPDRSLIVNIIAYDLPPSRKTLN